MARTLIAPSQAVSALIVMARQAVRPRIHASVRCDGVVTDGDPIHVTNGVGSWQITRGATYRELWIAPDGSGSLASREITLT